MSRKTKVVDHIEYYVTNEKFQVTLNISSGEFWINLTGHNHIVKADTLEKVKADAKEWLRENAGLDMKPVIVVRMEDPVLSYGRDNEKSLMLQYERYFVGIRKDKKKIWKKWENTGEIPEGERSWQDCLEGKPSSVSDSPWDEARSKIIPYTVEKWKGLRNISKLIRAMNTRLAEIVESKNLEGFLLDIYKKDIPIGLPAPKKND